MTERPERWIRLNGGPLAGTTRLHVGEILRVEHLPPPDWSPPPGKPPRWEAKIGRYEDAGRMGRGGFWRFEWRGWY